WAVRAFLAGGAIVVVIGVFALACFYLDRHGLGDALRCGYGGMPAGPYLRLCLPFRLPNMLADYLVVFFPLLLACGTLLGRRAVTLPLIACTCAVMPFTFSAGLGGFAIAGAIVWVGARRRSGKRWNVLDSGAALAAGGVAAVLALTMVATLQPAGRGQVSLGS